MRQLAAPLALLLAGASLPALVAAAPAVAIAEVQGRGAQSPLLGRTVQIEGVVTLAFRDARGGVFVQSLLPDADPASAEGLFLLPAKGQPALQPGQHLRATGRVVESGGGASLTSLAAARIEVLGRAALPEAQVLHAPPADWEALEGMRVRVAAPLTVSGNHTLQRFGEVELAFGGRLFTPTEKVAPGAAARQRLAENRARRLLLDDARADPEPATIDWLPEPLSDAAPLRAGSVLHGVSGVVDERFGRHRLQAERPVQRIEQAPRPPVPEVAGDLRIVGMNLLNLFNGDGRGGGFPTARGARNAEAWQRQLAKHVAAIRALDPDLLALQEVENDGSGPDSAIGQLAAALNAAQPAARWAVVVPPDRPGGDAIAVGLLYRADRLEALGRPALRLGRPFDWGNRPPLAMSFRSPGGTPFTVVSLHFKSKGGCEDADPANRDQGDGQGCFNPMRVTANRALAEWIATDPTGSGAEAVALIGDFNAYAQEDPIRLLRDAGWLDAFAAVPAERQYSFVFDGQAGRLDHALINPAMAARLRGAAKWHNNSDESAAFGYDGSHGRRATASPWRASDHDPLLIGIDSR
ncbi:ExeM/NucH family extracellular endonuclease [Silanimonas sp.]|uniref:ExeM/NucH family extracellular endonuclease n=1 Tax=Silanimonas sp. TaxID=1929290 RepID=UPI001BB96C92|nr:ExeM/NucH family extracellular endonuclease [Silanimonas sp.]MBS3896779.1 ExeM/NucH family extracellular endonuclease [Silanimonas sp.]MBS3924141.1 ExeM/NucH family extracellular endonuclease [Xanthomonadaceae bacterium]